MDPVALARMADADTAFAFDLYHQLPAPPVNSFFSPYSIAAALTMTHAGARGLTAEQMASVLHVPFAEDRVHEVRSQLDADLAAVDESLVLRVANSLWPQAGYPFRDEFLELVGRWYAAAVKVVDYIEAADAARLAINTWVEEHTEGKVRDLVPPGGVDAMTRLVLVNAIYLNGTWVHQFDAASTRTGPFHLLDGQTREMPLMEQTDDFRYSKGDGWRAAQLPYRGQASMLVVVPDEGRFAEVEARFGPDLLAEVREMLEPRRLHVVLPRFELTSALELSAALTALGMVDAFDPTRADLTGMTALRELFVSEVFHKAFVAVDGARYGGGRRDRSRHPAHGPADRPARGPDRRPAIPARHRARAVRRDALPRPGDRPHRLTDLPAGATDRRFRARSPTVGRAFCVPADERSGRRGQVTAASCTSWQVAIRLQIDGTLSPVRSAAART
jgi:serpin B